MFEELMISFAQVVDPGSPFAVRLKRFLGHRHCRQTEIRIPCIGLGSEFLFHLSERRLAFAVHHFYQSLIVNVSQFEFRKHKWSQ